MNVRRHPYTGRTRSCLAAALLAASCVGTTVAAQSYGQPYYDAVRDVMVTPSLNAPSARVDAAPTLSVTDPSVELVVRNGQLISGPYTIRVEHGAKLTLVVQSDTADALRVDGYNLATPLYPGQPVMLSFTAEQPGRFVYRLARSGRELGVLEVAPPSTAAMR